MAKTKRLISVIIAVLMLFSFAMSAFAEKATDSAEAKANDFGLADAERIALTAAKSKMILEGLSNDLAAKAEVTKVSYNEETGRYKAVVRAEYKYKYTCYIATNTILGKTIGFLADSDFDEQNVVKGFLGQFFEKIGYYFIKKFA